MSNINVSITLDSRRLTKKGYPVKLRLTEYNTSYYIALKMYFSKQAYAKITTSKRLNEDEKFYKSRFQQLELKAISILRDMDEFYFDDFKNLYLGISPSKKSTQIEVLFKTYIDNLTSNQKYNNAAIYKNTLASLNSFKSNISINAIDTKFLDDYQKFMITHNKSITTISLYLRSLRAILNQNRELIKKYPFDSYKIPKPNNNKRAINESDLKNILTYSFTNEVDNKNLDLFKFSFYSGGANVRDIITLKPSNIVNGILEYKRSKTGAQVKIHLLPEAMEIINRYSNNNEYLFDLIDNEEAFYIHRRTKQVVKGINKRLKKICNILNIPTITTYSARHSFATVLMNKNISIAFISNSLGHKSISTTQNYLGSFTQEQMATNMQALI